LDPEPESDELDSESEFESEFPLAFPDPELLRLAFALNSFLALALSTFIAFRVATTASLLGSVNSWDLVMLTYLLCLLAYNRLSSSVATGKFDNAIFMSSITFFFSS
jgi:hypothetical protein